MQVVQEVTEELEAKLLEEQTNFVALQTEKAALLREFEEVKRQIEEDADRCATPPLAPKCNGSRSVSLSLLACNQCLTCASAACTEASYPVDVCTRFGADAHPSMRAACSALALGRACER